MFCYQCEQTAKGQGCDKIGVCGKQPEVADLQDLLIYALQGLSLFAVEARKVGITDKEADSFTCYLSFFYTHECKFRSKIFSRNDPACGKDAGKSQGQSRGGRRQDRLRVAGCGLPTRRHNRGTSFSGRRRRVKSRSGGKCRPALTQTHFAFRSKRSCGIRGPRADFGPGGRCRLRLHP